MLFYRNYDAICKMRGTSASAAAKAIGRSKGAASNWKANGTLPKEDELIALAEYLNCTVADFFKDPDEPLSDFARDMEGCPAGTFGKPLPPEPAEEEPDECQVDFLVLYDKLNGREKVALMNLVYQFADDRGVEL